MDPVTSKVAVVSVPDDPDIDVDYLFLQVGVDTAEVSDRQNCGNLLAGIGPFAVEWGLVAAQDGRTTVRIRMVNTDDYLGLTVNGQDGDSVHLRTFDDYEHHSLVLTAAVKPGLRRTALRTSSEKALRREDAELEATGHAGHWVEDEPGIGRLYLTADPDGHEIASTGRPSTTRRRPHPAGWGGPGYDVRVGGRTERCSRPSGRNAAARS